MSMARLRSVARRCRRVLVGPRFSAPPAVRPASVAVPELIDGSATVQDSTLIGPVRLGPSSKVVGGVILSGDVSVGRFTVINGPNTDVFSRLCPVTIGAFCSIARSVAIQEYNHRIAACSSFYILRHVFGDSDPQENESDGPISIGNDVWIGTQCVVLSGASIGDGAVVGANSVVRGHVPPYAVVAGSPARVLRFRFTEDVVAELLRMRWWDWPIDRIRRNRPLFEGELTADKLMDVA